MAVVYFLGACVVRVSRQNLDCQDIDLLRYLEDAGKESLDMASALSLGLVRMPDEVSLEPA